MDAVIQHRRSSYAVNLGLLSNIFLALLKTGIGIIGHSSALLADGINSATDVTYYIAVKIFITKAQKPADENHPYGHSQMESIAALVVGSFVMATAIAIFWDSVNSVYDIWTLKEPAPHTSAAAFWAAFLTISIKIFLTVFTGRIGRDTRNPAIAALAYDHKNDIFASSAAACGIFFARQGYPWIDPLAGALVAVIILTTGIQIIRESSSDLMDTIPGNKLKELVIQELSDITEIKEIEEIRAHRFGPYFVFNLTIGIDGSLSVEKGDIIAELAEKKLLNKDRLIRRVYVHYHPCRKQEGIHQ